MKNWTKVTSKNNLDPSAIMSFSSRDSTARHNWRLNPTQKRHYSPGNEVDPRIHHSFLPPNTCEQTILWTLSKTTPSTRRGGQFFQLISVERLQAYQLKELTTISCWKASSCSRSILKTSRHIL